MQNVLAWIVATAITLPLLAWYLVYIVTVKMTRKKKFSFRLAVDISTIFFILSVHFIIVELFGHSFLWVILLLMIGAAVGFTVLHWKTKEDIQIHKVIKGAWRFNFLLFSTSYIVLLLIGLVHRIITV
ncbi:DUF3397 domain-containing protein [Guptibacillus hwajinpoensis]|uniref:Uncharacterized membrane protein (DUF485 family) n=1 Tax=Guptibacillus hwajinpoensis TaxID=208199 RepID=A0ABU0K0A2_9BACL|nr:DUF3397 domain-containing protein [Alkalihalobacillus hemicentroti]MDQ0482788.1 uncharacterized membrane protein (DUF485 family) [Alkalihalobacillus hemicentroti]